MEPILGIDLGTTNSVVAILQGVTPTVLPVEEGRRLLPSAVGLTSDGQRLVGTPARNQALLAPERTILSVKRKMGEDVMIPLGDQQLTPQEVSAVILRTLKERAEEHLGRPVHQAVITVPAFFNEVQRTATKQAGELAGLEVLRIINEPTAAALVYEPKGTERERLLIYDLGGGTFDVSIVQMEEGVVEVLSSHGDTHLGGDDFDRLLLDHVCERFSRETAKVDLREDPATRSRLLQAVEAAKCRLSSEAVTTIEEAFLGEHLGKPLNLKMTIDRPEYEELIHDLILKTIRCVDEALDDAKLLAKDISRVILVGGSSRTPLVQQMLTDQLQQAPHMSIDPDLCVAMGAAVQGGLIAGLEVGPVLVDITPHTLGVRCVRGTALTITDRHFARLIHRNSPLPASRSHIFYTVYPGQKTVNIEVFQGENDDVQFNEHVGILKLDGLSEDATECNEVLVQFDLDLDGTLKVVAKERATALRSEVAIQNAVTEFSSASMDEAKQRLANTFGFSEGAVDEAIAAAMPNVPPELETRFQRMQQLFAKAERLSPTASEPDAAEIQSLTNELRTAFDERASDKLDVLTEKLEDVLFYLEDA